MPGAGGIGRVRAVGPDATELAVGDWVFCDPTVRSRDNAQAPDIILQGLTAGGERAQRLQKYFRDGSFAEQMRVPTENVVRSAPSSDAEAGEWCALGNFSVPYGGLLAASLQPGETVLVNGATGAFGSAAVAVALAMGAGARVATGRNQKALDDLARRFGGRVRPVRMTGRRGARPQGHPRRGAGADRLRARPPAAGRDAAQVRAALLAVRPYGRVVLMGGVAPDVGRAVRVADAQLRHHPRPVDVSARFLARLIALVRAGLLSLGHHQAKCFGLDEVNEAIAHAAANAGPFTMTVLRP